MPPNGTNPFRVGQKVRWNIEAFPEYTHSTPAEFVVHGVEDDYVYPDIPGHRHSCIHFKRLALAE